MMDLAEAMAGMEGGSAIDFGTSIAHVLTERQAMLPIRCNHRVPTEYAKQYGKEEYLLEIYKKIGIQVL